MASSSTNTYNSPCAACKFLRRKCMPGCIFAPYFPPEEPHKFANVHKIFGASNVTKLLNELLPHQREDAVNSLAYEAEARVRDPVYGCVGAISYLQRQVHKLQKELDAANADLVHYGLSTSAPGNLVDLVCQPQPLQLQQLNPVYRLSGASPVMTQQPRGTGGSYGTFLPWNIGHDQQGGQLLSDVEDEVEQWFTVNKPTTQEQQVSNRALHCDRWLPPEPEFMKCNLHANWRNAHLHSGLAWITRDHQGNVAHHARDAITFAPNRCTAELRCVIWALQSLHDLGASKIIIASDYQEVIDAIKAPQQWPKFRSLLEEIRRLKEGFSAVIFEGEKTTANAIARDIAKSVLRDGRFQSYLALGGPSWLSERIAREHNGNDV